MRAHHDEIDPFPTGQARDDFVGYSPRQQAADADAARPARSLDQPVELSLPRPAHGPGDVVIDPRRDPPFRRDGSDGRQHVDDEQLAPPLARDPQRLRRGPAGKRPRNRSRTGSCGRRRRLQGAGSPLWRSPRESLCSAFPSPFPDASLGRQGPRRMMRMHHPQGTLCGCKVSPMPDALDLGAAVLYDRWRRAVDLLWRETVRRRQADLEERERPSSGSPAQEPPADRAQGTRQVPPHRDREAEDPPFPLSGCLIRSSRACRRRRPPRAWCARPAC